MIDGRTFFLINQYKKYLITHDYIKKIATGQGDD